MSGSWLIPVSHIVLLSGCIIILLLDDKEDTCKSGAWHTPFWFFAHLIILFYFPGTLIVVVDQVVPETYVF